ncbi:hypothetical protein [Hoeflea poritis]|uniref:Helix-turn-helix domain-containing protein n=1 Tax=Hoeflea poritis TaxID=2993659 RepID=A0ABT4VPH1_9HYPH|nr:hypothetical protein [Hoeflea poritis]MDA4846613.1 hypothetical protein [Hoeflea poritis]
MAEKRSDSGRHFLPVGEAARLLGLSRMRLREAIAKGVLPARRDNEGRLRVDLTSIPPDLEGQISGKGMAPAELLDTLFDEVEELQGLLAERDEEIGKIHQLLERQDSALAQSMDLLAKRNEQAGPQDDRTEELAGVSDRALAMLDDATARLEAALQDNARYRQLLERALSLSDAATAPGRDSRELTEAADRAMSLLDRALQEAERKGAATAELSAMLERALATGERLESQIRESERLVRRHEAAVGRMIGISERAINLVTVEPRRRWWWLAWLTGR